MKYKLLYITFFAFSTWFSYAQSDFGIIAGLSNSTLTDGFLRKIAIDKAFGFHLGGVYQYHFNDKIAFNPKLLVSLQGDRAEGDGGSGSIGGLILDYRLTYINMPLNFKFFSKPYITTGPQIGYLIATQKRDFDVGEIENKFDFGVNLGFGYDIGDFFIEASMYQGITKLIDVDRPPNTQVYYGGGVTNTVLQLSFGYYFK